MNINKKRAAIIGTVAAVALSGTGVAYAYWTTTGTGSGSATTGTSAAWTITDQGTAGDPLSPGGPVQTASFDVSHTGSGAQRLNQVLVSVDSAWGSAATCSAADFSIGGAPAGQAFPVTVGVDVNPGDVISESVTIQMVNRNADQNGCKNVTVPLVYHAS